MTINNQTVEVTYVGDGSQTDFPVTFDILDPIQVKWTPYEGNVVETTPDSGNWVVRFGSAPTGEVHIYRETPITQETEYRPYDSFPAEAHESALDKLTQIDQEQQAQLDLTIQWPEGTDPDDVGHFLPDPEAGKALKWNEEENALINSTYDVDEIPSIVEGFANSAATSANESALSATHAGESAQNALLSAESAANSAEQANDTWEEFNSLYLGSLSSPPSTDNEGKPLEEGALYFNSSNNKMYVWDGSSWFTAEPDEVRTYRLETDANLRGTPMIQLVDQDDMYSDVAMIAGSGINIVSGPSSMTFSATESGIGLDNSEPWTHAQYNTLVDAPITNNGSGAPRASVDLQDNPNVRVSPLSGGSITFCTVFSSDVDKDGIYANLLLDPVASYTFDASKFVVDDIDESKWLYVRLISSSGRWFQIGSNYLGEPGGLGGGGKILQVVQEVYSTQIATSSLTYVTSELKASITPSSTSSKILVIAKVTAFYNSGGGGDPTGGAIALFRNGSNIVDVGSQMYSATNGIKVDAGIYFLDSPSLTSSLNYEIYFKQEFGGNQFCHDNDTPSTIILMEVAG